MSKDQHKTITRPHGYRSRFQIEKLFFTISSTSLSVDHPIRVPESVGGGVGWWYLDRLLGIYLYKVQKNMTKLDLLNVKNLHTQRATLQKDNDIRFLYLVEFWG